MEALIKLETEIRKSSEEGIILITRENLEQLLASSESISEVLAQGLKLGMLKKHKSVTQRGNSLYSLKAEHLSPEVLKWSILALEKFEVIPFTTRIQDVLDCVFSLKATREEIFKVFREMKKRKYTRQLPNGSIEKVLPFSDLFNYKISRISPITYNEFYKTESIFSCELKGVYARSLFYFVYNMMPSNMSFSDIYKCVEKSEDRRTTHMKAPQLKALISYTIMESGAMSLKELEKILVLLLKNIQVPGFYSFYDFIKTQPEFVISELPEEDEECPICLENLNQSGFLLSCKHLFHPECLKAIFSKWQKEHFRESCPTCRQVISKEEIQRIMKSQSNPKRKVLREELVVSISQNNPKHFLQTLKLMDSIETKTMTVLDDLMKQNTPSLNVHQRNGIFGKCNYCNFTINFNSDLMTVSCNVCGTWHCTKCLKVLCSCSFS